jgi:hypothetical protein
MRARLGDEVLFLERSSLAFGDFLLLLCSEDEVRPNKLLLSNLSKPLDDNLLLCSEDEDRPELLLLSNLSKAFDGFLLCSEDEDTPELLLLSKLSSKPLDDFLLSSEVELMSAKLHVWLAELSFDFDDFLPFPCSDEEERLMSAKRGAE